MSKKTQRERDRQKRLFELSILLPSFHYLYIQLKVAHKRLIQNVENDPKKLPKEFILTDTLGELPLRKRSGLPRNSQLSSGY